MIKFYKTEWKQKSGYPTSPKHAAIIQLLIFFLFNSTTILKVNLLELCPSIHEQVKGNYTALKITVILIKTC